jgi:hypothetical protein
MARKRKKSGVSPLVGKPMATTGNYGISQQYLDNEERQEAAQESTSGLSLNGATISSGVNTNAVLGADGKPITTPSTLVKDPTKPLAAQNYLTPAEMAQAKAAPAVAAQIEEPEEEKSWLANLFDTTDTWKENEDGSVSYSSEDLGMFGLESIFDSGMRALMWGTDRLSQATVAAVSAAPGGMRTLTWDEAGQVSFGQAIVSNAAISEGRRRRGETQTGDFFQIAAGGFASFGAYIAGQADPDTALQQEGFDPLDVEDREAFNEGWEKFFSGATDFGFAFADPTIIGGWVTRLGRLRYVDQIIDTPEKMQKAVSRVVRDKTILDNNLDAAHGTAAVQSGAVTVAKDLGDAADLNISPEAMFIHNATRVGADGQKVMRFEDIYNHKVIRWATSREAIAVALHNAKDYDEAALIMRYAWGDASAAKDLLNRRPELLSELIDAERELVNLTMRANPKKQAEILAGYSDKMDRYDLELQWLKDNGSDLPDIEKRLDFVRTKKNTVAEKWLEASNGNFNLPATAAELELATARVKALKARDEGLMRALDQAGAGSPSGVYGSLRESTKGFARDNKFGRAVEKSRQNRARAQYETEATRGVSLWESTDFAHLNGASGKARRVARVWRYMGAEAPSGVVHIAGVGAQESVREVRALLNSVRIYGGKSKTWTNAKGEAVEIGGVAKKERLLTQYANAIALGGVKGQEEAAKALKAIEETIQNDIVNWYGFNAKQMDQIVNEINKSRAAVRESILSRGFWVEDGKENLAPYLENHLQSSEIMANWRAVEKKVSRTVKDKSYGPALAAAEKWTADSYALFQDLWRPSVLLRLGYTQRNVAEGLFRSSAMQFSLAPLGLAAKQLGLSTGNLGRSARYGRQATRGAVEKSVVAAREGATIDQMPKKFQSWHAKQVEAVDEQLGHNETVMNMAVDELAAASEPWRLAEVERMEVRLRQLVAQNAELRKNPPSGMSQADIQQIVDRNSEWMQSMYPRLSRLRAIRGQAADLPEDLSAVADNLLYFDQAVQPLLLTQKHALQNVRSAASMFSQQTLAKRRVGQGSADITDPETLKATFLAYMDREAFDPNDSFASIALANLSADHTTRQALALRMSTAERLLSRSVDKMYVQVNPGEKNYWEGMAVMLNQWKASDVGQMIIRDIADGNLPDDEIATRVAMFLRSDPRGREIAAAVTDMNKGGGPHLRDYSERMAAAEAAAIKAAKPEEQARDAAETALMDAHDALNAARADLKVRQQTNPRLKALIHPVTGKRITDEAAFIKRYEDRFDKAEAAYNAKVAKGTVDPGLNGKLAPKISMEDALQYAATMVSRYRQLTANSPELHQYLAGVKNISDQGDRPMEEFARALETLIGPTSKNANGDPYALIPVIGNGAKEVGSPTFLESVRNATNAAFRVLGTIPEDTLVRAPFYSKRFNKAYDGTIVALQRSLGREELTLREINIARQTAHRRALKDTKDWLYTIDRRTLLGDRAEWALPFISASQNSITTVGRILWNDPRVLAIMGMIWQLPDKAGITDEDGVMHFTMPLEWIPEDLRSKLGLSAMQDITFSKNQFNLILPESGFGGMIPTPGPVVVVPFSTMMQHGIFGINPESGPLHTVLEGIVGPEQADQYWDTFKSYIYGSDKDIAGMSVEPLSLDKAMPPWMQKVYQLWRGEGSSVAYTSWYDKIYQSEYQRWLAGERDTPPTPDEVSEQTNWFYALRIGANLTAFTPPGYTSIITPIVKATQSIYDRHPDDPAKAREEIYKLFGGNIQQIIKMTATESVAGLDASEASLVLAREHSDMIGVVAPALNSNDTLDTLGVLAGAAGDYDPSFSAAQSMAQIPNTNRSYREARTPAEAFIDSQVSAGWTQYIKNMDMINATLAQRGLKSLQSNGAEDLAELKDRMVQSLRTDPRYTAWYGDYANFASSRTVDTVLVLQTAQANQKWRAAHKDDPVWQEGGAVDQYLYGREQTIERLASTEDSDEKKAIRAEWAAFRFDLGMRYPDWGTKQERYLTGDDNPEQPQVILQEQEVAVQQEAEQPTAWGAPLAPDDGDVQQFETEQVATFGSTPPGGTSGY